MVDGNHKGGYAVLVLNAPERYYDNAEKEVVGRERIKETYHMKYYFSVRTCFFKAGSCYRYQRKCSHVAFIKYS